MKERHYHLIPHEESQLGCGVKGSFTSSLFDLDPDSLGLDPLEMAVLTIMLHSVQQDRRIIGNKEILTELRSNGFLIDTGIDPQSISRGDIGFARQQILFKAQGLFPPGF